MKVMAKTAQDYLTSRGTISKGSVVPIKYKSRPSSVSHHQKKKNFFR